jgi:DNA-binding MarR family transcriptional regulator
MSMILRLTQDVLRHYPQIYLACHLEHPRARTNAFRLTDKDIVLLGHLDHDAPMLAGPLARHLGVGAPALSAQLTRLAARGFIARRPRPRDRRHVELRLTALGAEAMATTSILDPGRVTALLVQLKPAERARAVRGLALLAQAARQLQFKYPKQRKGDSS